MDRKRLLELLGRVQAGETSPAEAAESLARLPYEDLGFARVDTHRALRCGFPEVLFCAGKTPEQIREISARLLAHGGRLLATRADAAAYEAIAEAAPDAEYHEAARAVTVSRDAPAATGLVTVLCAGTADIPVAEEARVTAEALGARTETVYDCGVAGIHRLLGERDRISKANALVVVAGMEGALASVVGGLVDRPVIAVPTSIGYGASFSGLAPLLTMLNSCAAGVTVVNIDNGFGGGYAAALVNRLAVDGGTEEQSR
jgi:NCAIR mutase (PurE)-related protein